MRRDPRENSRGLVDPRDARELLDNDGYGLHGEEEVMYGYDAGPAAAGGGHRPDRNPEAATREGHKPNRNPGRGQRGSFDPREEQGSLAYYAAERGLPGNSAAEVLEQMLPTTRDPRGQGGPAFGPLSWGGGTGARGPSWGGGADMGYGPY
ncbi:MAG: hypothetical protein Q9203_003826 [Teloschistes exilis]